MGTQYTMFRICLHVVFLSFPAWSVVAEAGHKLMTDLNDITGVHYSAPTGIIGNYNHGQYDSLSTRFTPYCNQATYVRTIEIYR